jgi:hypothetical protein
MECGQSDNRQAEQPEPNNGEWQEMNLFRLITEDSQESLVKSREKKAKGKK